MCPGIFCWRSQNLMNFITETVCEILDSCWQAAKASSKMPQWGKFDCMDYIPSRNDSSIRNDDQSLKTCLTACNCMVYHLPQNVVEYFVSRSLLVENVPVEAQWHDLQRHNQCSIRITARNEHHQDMFGRRSDIVTPHTTKMLKWWYETIINSNHQDKYWQTLTQLRSWKCSVFQVHISRFLGNHNTVTQSLTWKIHSSTMRTEASVTTAAGVGIFCVYPRFHPTAVWWNLKWIQKTASPCLPEACWATSPGGCSCHHSWMMLTIWHQLLQSGHKLAPSTKSGTTSDLQSAHSKKALLSIDSRFS